MKSRSTKFRIGSKTGRMRKPKVYLAIMKSILGESRLPMGISQNLYKFTRRLKSWKFIRKISTGTWEATDSGRRFFNQLNLSMSGCSESLVIKDPIKLDFCARILIPIIKNLDNPFPFDQITMTGKQYHYTSIPEALDGKQINLTIELTKRNNLLVYVHHTKMKRSDDLEILMRKIMHWTKEYFSTQRICLIDIMGAKTSYIKYGILDPMARTAIEDGRDETIYLGRKRAKILENDDPGPAYVNVDNTPDNITIHTNDQSYKNHYLMMPERVARLEGHLGGLVTNSTATKNILLNMSEIMKNQSKLMEKLEKAFGSEKDGVIFKDGAPSLPLNSCPSAKPRGLKKKRRKR